MQNDRIPLRIAELNHQVFRGSCCCFHFEEHWHEKCCIYSRMEPPLLPLLPLLLQGTASDGILQCGVLGAPSPKPACEQRPLKKGKM